MSPYQWFGINPEKFQMATKLLRNKIYENKKKTQKVFYPYLSL